MKKKNNDFSKNSGSARFDKENMFSDVFFSEVRNDINITKEKVNNKVEEFISLYLGLSKAECKTKNLMTLCSMSVAKRFDVPLKNLKDVDLPDKIGLTESDAVHLGIFISLEYGLFATIKDDEVNDIVTINDLSELVFKKVKKNLQNVKSQIKRSYHENGKIAAEEQLSDDLLNGFSRIYSEKGVLISETCFDQGIEHGIVNNYNENGKLYSSYYNYNGDIEFTYRHYYENGAIKMEEEYEEGLLHGWSKTFNNKGELLLKDFYDDNILVERHILNKGIVKILDYPEELKKGLITDIFS